MFGLSSCDSRSIKDRRAIGPCLSGEQATVHNVSHAEDRTARRSREIHRSLDSDCEAWRTAAQLKWKKSRRDGMFIEIEQSKFRSSEGAKCARSDLRLRDVAPSELGS